MQELLEIIIFTHRFTHLYDQKRTPDADKIFTEGLRFGYQRLLKKQVVYTEKKSCVLDLMIESSISITQKLYKRSYFSSVIIH